jgi:hypothetical protein
VVNSEQKNLQRTHWRSPINDHYLLFTVYYSLITVALMSNPLTTIDVNGFAG